MSAAMRDVLTFWFGEGGTEEQNHLEAIKKQSQRWFLSTPEFDAQLKNLFEPLVQSAAKSELQAWRETLQGRLALIVLLDQFPRNIYRGTAQAFQYDPMALEIALETIALETTDSRQLGLSLFERAALYMPMQHSEELLIQQRGVACYAALTNDAPDAAWRDFLFGFEKFARLHCEIIQRFGRFPHRNLVLARQSTDEELEYLASGGVRFGQ